MRAQKENHIDYKKTLRIVTRELKVMGLWSNTEQFFARNVYSVYAVCIIVMCNVHYAIQVAYWFVVAGDIQTISTTGMVVFEEILNNVKVYGLMSSQYKLKEFLKKSKCDMFQPKTAEQKQVVMNTLNSMTRIFKIFSTSTRIAIFFFVFSPLLDKNGARLPSLAWYPYNTTEYFTATYVQQAISIIYMTHIHINVDSLSFFLMALIITQCDILSDSIRNIRKCDDRRKMNSCEDYEAVLFEHIKHHQEILSFFEVVYNMLNFTVFAQYSSSVFTLCSTLLQSTALEYDDPQLIVLAGYQIVVFGQLFLYCWWGNEVIRKSEELPKAAFESYWLGTTHKYRQNLLFFIHRTQKPLTIYALDYFKVSLDSFVMISRTTYSFYALIHTMNKH